MDDMWARVMGPSDTTQQYSQTIHFNDTEDKQAIEVIGEDVTVVCSGGTHNHGSSKVKLTSLVDFNWEPRLYMGQLVAVHMTGKYIAYGIKVQKPAQTIGMVRVVSRGSEQRALLRGMKGQVQDIAFAFIPTQYILGCVDEEGSLFVHNIDSDGQNILCTLLLHIVHKPDPSVAMYHRILWCPYMPEEDSAIDPDDDGAKLLVLTQGRKAEMWNVSQVNSQYGEGPHDPEQIEEGFLEIIEHKFPIIDAAFSPDGTALATASLDGDVKFFQVYMHNDSKPRCLHEWQPHGGKALSCLFFLDDHHTFIPDVQFWKFAITGCDNNTELKLWSCESWTCLQTIHFKPDPNRKLSPICLKAGLDNGAGYLILSDIQNRILYVLQIQKDLKESTAKINLISEFFLQSPILSFGIVDAEVRKLKCSPSIEDLYQLQDGLEIEENSIVTVVIRMYIVQPKSLQECRIVYQPNFSSSTVSLSNVSETINFKDGIIDLKSENEESVMKKSINNVMDSEVPNHSLIVNPEPINPTTSQPLNLLTPDSFNSPVRHERLDDTGSLISQDTNQHTIENSTSSENPLIPLMSSEIAPPPPDDMMVFQRLSKDNFASGGSSPSREVQEILSLNASSFSNEFYENDSDKGTVNVKTENDSEIFQKTSSKEFVDVNDETNDEDDNKLLEGDEWPKIPIMKVDEVIKSEESRMPNSHANEQDVKVKEEEIDIVATYTTNVKEDSIFKKIVSQKLISLEDQIQQQNMILQELQRQISDLDQHNLSKMLEPNHTQLKNLITNQIDSVFSNHLAEQNKMLENWMFARSNKEREYQESLMSAVSQVVGNNVVDKLETVVSAEIQKNIIPQIINVLEPLKRQLHIEMTQKLTTTDHLLKENITKLVHSKCVMDVLATSVVSALKPHIENTFKDTLTNSLLPSWERVCQTMFQQMHETFTQGTKEYTTCLETHLEKQRRSQEKGRDIVNQLQNVSDSMRTNSEHLANSLSNEIQQQIQKAFVNFQETVKKTIRQEVKEQIDRSFRNHAAVLEDSVLNAVKSRAVTPSPHILDSQVQQAQIQQLIAQGQINAAFQQALSASDLSLVVYTCEKVNPQDIFNQTPCVLQQNVLLSLIQQLSADMSNHTEIKYKYLEEAVMNLQKTNPMTREHIPGVLKELQKQLTAYITANPNNKITRQMKMLLMATHSLLQ